MTLPELLAAGARVHPERVALRMPAGELTYREADSATDAIAAGLRRLGVAPGDLVTAMLPNCQELALSWLAIMRLGAVAAPINTAFRGAGLAHAINTTRSRLLLADAGLLEPLAAVGSELRTVERLVVRGEPVTSLSPTWRVEQFEQMAAPADAPVAVSTDESALATLLFTSGTTGRSKACMLSHRYLVRQAELFAEHVGLRSDDVLYSPFPLFHVDAAVLTVAPALLLGATAAIGERFSASGFWDEARAFRATVFDFMGATLTMLHRQPPSPGDADHDVRLAWGVPMPEFAPDFERRFGLRLIDLYGLTDAGIVVYHPLDAPRRAGSCGRPVAPFDVRLVDERDHEVPVGEVGEIVIRSDEPSLLMDGYYGMPEATVAAWRNLWLHTGDLARRDPDGYIYFVGRGKDVIRRRGENISAFEVEEVVKKHPDVLDAAAYPVPSELTEDEVMVAVVARPGHEIDIEDLLWYCAGRMARYMIPRYVDVLPVLPRTPTEKVEKHVLIERGVTPTTWDRGRHTTALHGARS